MKQLFVAKGHTPGRDPGAVIEGIAEIHQIARFTENLEKRISNLNSPFEIVMVPWLSLKDQIKWINSRCKKGDIAFQIHFDIGDKPGRKLTPIKLGGYYTSKRGFTLVHTIIAHAQTLSKDLKVKSSFWCRDAKESRFGRIGFIDDTIPTSFLFEAGYVASDNEFDFISLESLILAITSGFKTTPVPLK